MKYCPNCQENRPAADDYCSECFTELLPRPVPDAAPESIPPPIPPVEPAAAAAGAGSLAAAPPASPAVEAPSEPPLRGSSEPALRADDRLDDTGGATPLDPPRLISYLDEPDESDDRYGSDAPATGAEPEAEIAYDEVAREVAAHVRNGYDLFGFAGHVNSGKTHCLKALSYLLEEHGFDVTKFRQEFRDVPVPENTQARIFDAVFSGGRWKWVFVDAGGELYQMIQENDWHSAEPNRTKLTHWLHNCKGLFLFLHLDRGHFNKWLADTDYHQVSSASLGEAERLERSVETARDKQKELEFFGHFLLFLRALKHEEGDVLKVIAQCRNGNSLEESLRGYAAKAPLLDIPVMFFFSQADAFYPGFEISAGVHLEPRSLPMPATLFAARYLPGLFGGLLDHARRFKFDFLQSYEEYETGAVDDRGKPFIRTAWHTPDDQVPLSAGLMSGLELALRHQPTGRPWWQGAGLDTRRSLRLHKILHPRLWRGIKVDLGRRR